MESTLNEIDVEINKATMRKALIPRWIKVFGWLFIFMGAVVPFLFFGSIIFGFVATYTMFGLEYQGPALSVMPVIISTLILVNGICAYGLLYGKDWGLKACIIYGYVGLALTLGNMIYGIVFTDNILIRFEPLVQIPYLLKLHKIRSNW